MLLKYVFMQQSNSNWLFEAMVDYGACTLLTTQKQTLLCFFNNMTDKPKGNVAAKKTAH